MLHHSLANSAQALEDCQCKCHNKRAQIGAEDAEFYLQEFYLQGFIYTHHGCHVTQEEQHAVLTPFAQTL